MNSRTRIEDGPVKDQKAGLDGFVTQRLGQMRLPHSRGAQEQHIFGLPDEAAGGQLEELPFVDGRVEAPVKVFQGLEAAEVGGLGAPGQFAFLAHVQFILQDQLQELGMGEAIGGGFLQPHAQALAQAGQTQVSQGGFKVVHKLGMGLRVRRQSNPGPAHRSR
jgi:hypothetical protein